MSINKLGLSDQDDDSFHRWNGILRKYVNENALCRVATDFDAGLCKIRRVAPPIDDHDVVNKRFMHQNIQILKDRQDEIEKKNGALGKYVHENALCRVATDFDAGLCKIRRVAPPIDDHDVVNKRFVHQNMQILKDRQDEIEKNITSLQTNREFMLKYLQENIQTFKNQLDILDKKTTTIQNSIQGSSHRIDKTMQDSE